MRKQSAKFIFELGERRPVVTTVHTTGLVEFRFKRTRLTYEAHMRSLFTRAVQNFIEDQRRQKKADRVARRAARG